MPNKINGQAVEFEVKNPADAYVDGDKFITFGNGRSFFEDQVEDPNEQFNSIALSLYNRYPQYAHFIQGMGFTPSKFWVGANIYSSTMSAISTLSSEPYDRAFHPDDLQQQINMLAHSDLEKMGVQFTDQFPEREQQLADALTQPDFADFMREATFAFSKLGREKGNSALQYDNDQNIHAKAFALQGMSELIGLSELGPKVEKANIVSGDNVVKQGVVYTANTEHKISFGTIHFLETKNKEGKLPIDNPKTMKNISDMAVMFYLSGRNITYISDLGYDVDQADGSIKFKFDDVHNFADFGYGENEETKKNELEQLTFMSDEVADRIANLSENKYKQMLIDSGIKGKAIDAAMERLQRLKNKIANNDIGRVANWNDKYKDVTVKELGKGAKNGPVLFNKLYSIDEAVKGNMLGHLRKPRKVEAEMYIGDLDLKSKDGEELFGTPAENLRWGITKDGHVTHIITGNEIALVKLPVNDYRKVSQNESYTSDGDLKTQEAFLRLAKRAAEDYKKENNPPEFVEMLYAVRSYVTANSRSGQQKALKNLNKAIEKCQQTFDVDPYKKAIYATKGNLQVNNPGPVLKDPADVGLGHIGIWQKTDDALFPHEPSPNDIKQGGGVEDCFMLSALASIAANDPQKIKDAMKDNGDTVTVRFFDGENKTPVYITVNKTINKIGGTNAYASSSLWVQMIEKAYVGYLNTVVAPRKPHEKKLANGYEAINRGMTRDFMNAFDKDKKYRTYDFAFGSELGKVEDFYKIDKNGDLTNHPDGYMPHEEELYKFFAKHVNDKKEVLTVGSASRDKDRQDYVKDHGIRTGHAYSVMKVFEANVDGKIKKFVQLRDPYATFRSKYNENGELVNDSSIVSATVNAGVDNMGTFNLELTDFQKMFTSIAGMEKETADEFEKQYIANIRDYYKNPLTADEKDKFQYPISDDDYGLYVFGDEPVAEGADPLEVEKNAKITSILDMLNSRSEFTRIAKQIIDVADDLAGTDHMFCWTNTDKFDKLNKAATNLSQQMKKFIKDNPSPAELKKIAADMADLEKKAEAYAAEKVENIKKNDKGIPTIRGAHRLADAVSIQNICKGKRPLPTGKKAFSERINIVASDLQERYTRMANNQPIENKPDISLDVMSKTTEAMFNFIANNPKLYNRDDLNKESLAKLDKMRDSMKKGKTDPKLAPKQEEVKPKEKEDDWVEVNLK